MLVVITMCFGGICAWLVLEQMFIDLRTRPHVVLPPRLAQPAVRSAIPVIVPDLVTKPAPAPAASLDMLVSDPSRRPVESVAVHAP